jgi:hypothetical protein
VIALGDHQPPRDRADAAFHQTGMLVENEAGDTGIAQASLRPGQTDNVVRPKQLSQAGKPALSGDARPIAGPSIVSI